MWAQKQQLTQLLVLLDQLESFCDTENPLRALSISPDSFINMPHTPPEHAVVSAVLTKTAHLSGKNLYWFEIDYKNPSLSLRFLFCIYLPQWLISTSYLFCQSFMPFDQGFNTFRIYPERYILHYFTHQNKKQTNPKTIKHKNQPNKKAQE